MGLGDTKTYTNDIYINKDVIYNNQYQSIYPLGIKQGRIYRLYWPRYYLYLLFPIGYSTFATTANLAMILIILETLLPTSSACCLVAHGSQAASIEKGITANRQSGDNSKGNVSLVYNTLFDILCISMDTFLSIYVIVYANIQYYISNSGSNRLLTLVVIVV